MVMSSPEKWNLSDYERLPEGFPASLLDGEYVKEPSPAPWHQHLVLRLTETLLAQVGRRRLFVSPVDLVLDDVNVFQPDLVVFAEEVTIRPEDRWIEKPTIVIEVLSPSTEERDRGAKARRYLEEERIEELWLVDPETRSIEIRTRQGSRTHERGATAVSTAVPEVAIDVAALFRV
jgi:Uma2 family endonuclease